MRRRQQVRQRAERMVGGQRLLVEDIDGRASDLLVCKRRNEIGLDHDWPARSVYEARRWLHERQFRGAHKAARPVAEHQMDGEDIRLPKQLFLRDAYSAAFGRALAGEILAPGDHLHAESGADLRPSAADATETQKPEGPSGHVIANCMLPSAAA